MKNFLSSIVGFSKADLKPTTTVVTHISPISSEWKERVLKPFVFHRNAWSNKTEDLHSVIEEYAKTENESNIKSITCVSYNIWFDQFAREVRYNAILDICHKQNPDFICLQEVVKTFLTYACATKFVQENYVLTDVDTFANTVLPYGVAMLVHKRVFANYATSLDQVELKLVRLPTHMSRSALICSYTSKSGEKVGIATVHLESLSHRETRKEQMEIIHEQLSTKDVAFFMGDFNFDSEKNWSPKDTSEIEEVYMRQLFSDYIDIWRELKYDDDLGKTFDTATNAMIADHRPETMRYDRILMKGKKWTAKNIDMLGTQVLSVAENNTPIVPSDHYGLVCTSVANE
jgi:endonuclease/exonuclease/phosphatase family metal-dependent hydrolase